MAWEDEFETKARAAYWAALALRDGHPDAAADRAYFAAHHGIVSRIGPPGAGHRWTHAEMLDPERLLRAGLDREDAHLLRWLYRLRIQADYLPVPVGPGEATAAERTAAALLGRMGIEAA